MFVCENKCFQRGSVSVDDLLNAGQILFLHAMITGFLRAGNIETTLN